MKVAVIGNGNVGMATFKELLKMREIRELVLIGRNQEKLKAEIEDFLDAQTLSTTPIAKLSYGTYADTKGADIIVFTAGINQKPGQSRLELVEANANMTREIFSQVKEHNDTATIVVLSNPVDIITAVVRETMGLPRTKVIGTGTLLDTARLKRYISTILDVSPASTEMFVLGEHGDSSCVIWSSIRILGMTLDDYLAMDIGDDESSLRRDMMSDKVRSTAGKLIAAKGYTAYGVAACAGRVVSALINDTHEILPLSIVLNGEYGVNGLAVSVPCIVGSEGVIAVKKMEFTDDEKAAFIRSVGIVGETASNIGIEYSCG